MNGDTQFKYLRPRKAKRLKEIYEGIEKRTDLEIMECDCVSISPLGQLIDFTDHNRAELIIDDTDFCTELKPWKEGGGGEKLSGRSLFGGYLRKVWGHFLMGSLGRLWPLVDEEFAKKIDHLIFFASEKGLTDLYGNYKELLELLGVADKVKIYSGEVACEKLFIPEISFEHDKYNSKQCDDTFNLIIKNALEGFEPKIFNRKVFFTRTRLKGSTKNEIGLQDVVNCFEKAGYEIVSPEMLSIRELIRLMSETEILISVSGSLAHNVMLAPKGSIKKFVIIERHAMVNTFQANINLMKGIPIEHVDAFWLPRLSSSVGPVFLYGHTAQFKALCGSLGVNIGECTSKDKKRLLGQFFKRYRRYFGHAEMIQPWEEDFADLFSEAIIDTRSYFRRWLEEKMPLMTADYFNLHFLGRLVKALRR